MTRAENRSAPAVATARGAGAGFGGLRDEYTAGAPLRMLLARLERVQRHGRGFRADCPCGHTSRGTLSLSESETGAVLMHDFAGCSATDVLAAIGLDVGAMFPERIRAATPEQRRDAQRFARESRSMAALAALEIEATVVAIAARHVLTDAPLSAHDIDRVVLAAERIADCRSVLHGR